MEERLSWRDKVVKVLKVGGRIGMAGAIVEGAVACAVPPSVYGGDKSPTPLTSPTGGPKLTPEQAMQTATTIPLTSTPTINSSETPTPQACKVGENKIEIKDLSINKGYQAILSTTPMTAVGLAEIGNSEVVKASVGADMDLTALNLGKNLAPGYVLQVPDYLLVRIQKLFADNEIAMTVQAFAAGNTEVNMSLKTLTLVPNVGEGGNYIEVMTGVSGVTEHVGGKMKLNGLEIVPKMEKDTEGKEALKLEMIPLQAAGGTMEIVSGCDFGIQRIKIDPTTGEMVAVFNNNAVLYPVSSEMNYYWTPVVKEGTPTDTATATVTNTPTWTVTPSPLAPTPTFDPTKITPEVIATATATVDTTLAPTVDTENVKTMNLIKSFYEGKIDLNGPNNAYRFVDSNGKVLPISYFYDSGVEILGGGVVKVEMINTLSVYLGNYVNKNGLVCLIWGQINANNERLVWATGIRPDPNFPSLSKIQTEKSLTDPPIFFDFVNVTSSQEESSVILAALEPFKGRLVGSQVVAKAELQAGFCGLLNKDECVLYRRVTDISMGGTVLRDWIKGLGGKVNDLSYVLPPGTSDFSKLDALEVTLRQQGVQVPRLPKK